MGGTVVSFPKLGLEMTLNRVAFTIPGTDIEIYWYGIFIAFGALLAIIYAFRKAKTFGIDVDRMIDVVLVATVFGIVGSRIYYVAFAAPGEFTGFGELFNLRKGGVAFYGAVIGACLAAVVMCRLRKVPLRPMADLGAIGFLIGQGLGRWGNFMNQEAFGGNTELPFGMTSDVVVNYLLQNQETLTARGIAVDPYMPVHPTFLYESLWCLLGLLVLNWYIKRRRFDGEIFLLYCAWNGAGRFFIEGLRTDSLYIGAFRVSQMLALGGLVIAAIAVLIMRQRIKLAKDPDFMRPYALTDRYRTDTELLERQRAAAERKRRKKGAEETVSMRSGKGRQPDSEDDLFAGAGDADWEEVITFEAAEDFDAESGEPSEGTERPDEDAKPAVVPDLPEQDRPNEEEWDEEIVFDEAETDIGGQEETAEASDVAGMIGVIDGIMAETRDVSEDAPKPEELKEPEEPAAEAEPEASGEGEEAPEEEPGEPEESAAEAEPETSGEGEETPEEEPEEPEEPTAEAEPGVSDKDEEASEEEPEVSDKNEETPAEEPEEPAAGEEPEASEGGEETPAEELKEPAAEAEPEASDKDEEILEKK